VSSIPSGAAIFLDGSTTGKTTPATLGSVQAGSHTILCSKTGYSDQLQTVTVNGGETSTVSITFQDQGPLQDPIIGVWRYSNSEGYDSRYRFNSDGTYVKSLQYRVNSYFAGSNLETSVQYGTWSAQGGNSYKLHPTGTASGISITIKYNPLSNVIYDTRYNSLLHKPYQGDVMAAS
jgi:hypothetical protein